MIRSFLPAKGTKGTKGIQTLVLCFLSLFVAIGFFGCSMKPCRVMRPGPILCHLSIDHRSKRARLMGRAFIDVNDEAGQHHECRKIVNHITHGNNPAPNHVVEPHQHSRDQEQNGAHNDCPEIQLLTAIEESDVLEPRPFFIRRVLAKSLCPTPVRFPPRHRCKPVEELEKEKDREQQTKPGMKQSRSWSTTEEWCDPVEEPRRVDRESGQQRQNKKNRD